MKTFKQFLKEDKKPLKEDNWNDKTLSQDCQMFLLYTNAWGLNNGNQIKRWNNVLVEFNNNLDIQTKYKPLTTINKELIKVEEAIRKSYMVFLETISNECNSLLKRIDKEYKISNEKEILEEFKRQILMVKNNTK